ncbi:MAG: hypothetical protein HZA93_05815, partial [Verrucomicrobia bacterium]|nr:hypothetical protein [Verrucomicrobiota bacterium]
MRSHRSFCRRILAVTAAGLLGGAIVRADKPVWAGSGGSGTGGASSSGNWSTGSKPGKSETAQVSSGKATIDSVLEFGALEFTGGTIDAIAGNSLTLSLSTAASTWTGGEFSGATLNINQPLTIGAGAAKKVTTGSDLNLSGSTSWTGEDIGTGGGSQIKNASTGTFTASSDGKIAHDQAGTRATFRNDGTFTKSAGAGGTSATEIEATFNNFGTLNANAGNLKLSGGGSSSGSVNIGNGAKLQIASNDYAFSGGAINNTTAGGTGKLELGGAITTFSSTTSGDAELAVAGGTAKFDG